MYKPINGWTKVRIIEHIKNTFTIKSVDAEGVGCMYRGENGAKCAVGIFIPDNLYEEVFEGNTINKILHNYHALNDVLPLEVTALIKLQNIHDFPFFEKDPRSNEEIKAELVEWVEKNVI